MIGTVRARTPSNGTSTSRASLPRMRNLPKSTGTLPPAAVVRDLAIVRRRVVLAAVRATLAVVAGGLDRDVPAALAGLVGQRGAHLAGPATGPVGGQRDQRDRDDEQAVRLEALVAERVH